MRRTDRRKAPGDDRSALVLPSVPPGTQILLGRSRVSDVRFLEPTVSRDHAALQRVAGGWLVVDHRSTHGTFVNGRRVDRAIVHDGDTLALGRARPMVVRL
jgi:pSer/pThr/pTyr-binding forkhead associated (FHA) protein